MKDRRRICVSTQRVENSQAISQRGHAPQVGGENMQVRSSVTPPGDRSVGFMPRGPAGIPVTPSDLPPGMVLKPSQGSVGRLSNAPKVIQATRMLAHDGSRNPDKLLWAQIAREAGV